MTLLCWLRLSLEFREPVPWKVAQTIGMMRPPEYVFEYFRRIHGIDK